MGDARAHLITEHFAQAGGDVFRAGQFEHGQRVRRLEGVKGGLGPPRRTDCNLRFLRRERQQQPYLSGPFRSDLDHFGDPLQSHFEVGVQMVATRLHPLELELPLLIGGRRSPRFEENNGRTGDGLTRLLEQHLAPNSGGFLAVDRGYHEQRRHNGAKYLFHWKSPPSLAHTPNDRLAQLRGRLK